MFFLNLPFLFGISAAGIPLILHLIHKKNAPKVMFSTLRFLRSSNQKTAHRKKIQDLLLLILRALLFSLLAFALAKPFVRAASFDFGKAELNAVLILDDSYSMACRHEDQSRFAVAKKVAQAALQGLRAGDSVALLTTSGPLDPQTSSLTRNHDAINSRLAATAVSCGKGDMTAAVQKAYEILKQSKEANLEIYAITDMQKNSWSAVKEKDKEEKDAAAKKSDADDRVQLIVVDCGRDDYKNLALTDLALRSKIRVRGQPITLQSKVFNSSPRKEQQVATLYVDGEKRLQRSITVGASSEAVVSFTYTFEKGQAGGAQPVETHTGRIVLQEDSLGVDNERFFKVDVRDKIDVLVVQEDPSAVSFMNESAYLATALDPFRELSGAAGHSVISPTTALLGDLSAQKLENFAVIFLLNLSHIPDPILPVLQEYVKKGGGLVFFAGPNSDPAQYTKALYGSSGKPDGLLPVRFLPAEGDARDRTRSATVSDVDFEHTVLAPFKGLPMSLFTSVRVYRALVVTDLEKSSARKLLGLNDGRPLLVENVYAQKGKVMLFTTTANWEWSNLPVTNLFLPLMHRIVYYVTETTEQKDSYLVGSPVRFSFPELPQPLTIRMTEPSEKVTLLKSEKAGGTGGLVFKDTHTVGVYEYQVLGAPKKGAFVVNPDPAESDLTRITKEELQRRLPGRHLHFARNLSEMQQIVARLREGLQLRDVFLAIVLCLAVFECLLANLTVPEAKDEKGRRVVTGKTLGGRIRR